MRISGIIIVLGLTLTGLITGHNITHPKIQIPDGLLEGEYGHTEGPNERVIHKFWCIPYAKHQRFEPSQPADPWEGAFDATHCDRRCPQASAPGSNEGLGFGFPEEEDCLILNVFMPAESKGKLPVMVYIHGGYFIAGNSMEYSGELLLENDIVLVTISYRLGALGFLTSGDGVLESNLGLKDQVLALQWVQKNIHLFGGDPGRVTLFGASAGAASVSLHLLSPMSKGLFHGAITQSGSALMPIAYQSNPAKTFHDFVKAMNCTAPTTQESVACLKKLHHEDINEHISETKWFVELRYPVFPAIETVPPTKSPVFLPDHPRRLLREGKFQHVPLLTGVVEDEMAYLSSMIILNPQYISDLNTHWLPISSYALSVDHRNISEANMFKGLGKVRKFYFGEGEIDQSHAQAIVNMFSDCWYVSSLDATIRFHSKFAPVYPYIFTRKGSETNVVGHILNRPVVSHGEELPYLFLKGSTSTKEGKLFADRFRKLWVSFAYDGKPTGTWGSATTWPAAEPDSWDHKFYTLDHDTSLVESPFKARSQFRLELDENEWSELGN